MASGGRIRVAFVRPRSCPKNDLAGSRDAPKAFGRPAEKGNEGQGRLRGLHGPADPGGDQGPGHRHRAPSGGGEAVTDQDILGVLQTMVQTARGGDRPLREGEDGRSSRGRRPTRSASSRAFCPKQMSEDETASAVHGTDRGNRRPGDQGHGPNDVAVEGTLRGAHGFRPRERGGEVRTDEPLSGSRGVRLAAVRGQREPGWR